MMRKIAVAFASLTAIVSVAVMPNHKDIGKIVCFGDSITHGAKVQGHSWVYDLSREHPEYQFINEGRNGRKTSDREDLIHVINRNRDARLFLIFLGVNDLKDGNDSMVTACVVNAKWMIDEIRKAGGRTGIVILSPCEIDLRDMSPLNVKKKYNLNTEKSLVELDRRYRELAVEESIGFISLLRTVTPGNYADGLHPNREGQRELAAAVWKGLMERSLISGHHFR